MKIKIRWKEESLLRMLVEQLHELAKSSPSLFLKQQEKGLTGYHGHSHQEDEQMC